jgi:predicted enzyme related to lactoylglutathione lyase
MKITEIACAAYPVTDLPRARKFYEQTLRLVPSRFMGPEETWVEYDLGAATLAIGSGVPEWKPSAGGGMVALEVENFDEAIEHLISAGFAPFMGPFETPVCHLAVVSDPDGNSITIHKRK